MEPVPVIASQFATIATGCAFLAVAELLLAPKMMTTSATPTGNRHFLVERWWHKGVLRILYFLAGIGLFWVMTWK